MSSAQIYWICSVRAFVCVTEWVCVIRIVYTMAKLLRLFFSIQLCGPYRVSFAVNVSVSHIRCMDACNEFCAYLRGMDWMFGDGEYAYPMLAMAIRSLVLRNEPTSSFARRVPHSLTRTLHAYACTRMVSLPIKWYHSMRYAVHQSVWAFEIFHFFLP